MTDAETSVGEYDVAFEAQRRGFFETPVVVARMKNAAALLRDLEAVIRKRMTETPGVARSNLGGWHSDPDMFEWGGPAARKVAEHAVGIAGRLSHFDGWRPENINWLVQMWANVSPPGALNHPHAHPGNLWSAVFYVDLGAGDRPRAEVGGELYLQDPRYPLAAMSTPVFHFKDAADSPQSWNQELRPEPGDLVVFPAWLNHGVRAYTGEQERISIAINLKPQLTAQ